MHDGLEQNENGLLDFVHNVSSTAKVIPRLDLTEST